MNYLLKKNYPGINIQFPISRDIISGKKTIETREYPIPKNYLMKEMIIIETPGKDNRFKARGIAIIKFTDCFKYKNKSSFYKDAQRHLIYENSPWAWKYKEKYGWEVQVLFNFKTPFEVKEKRGIVYTKNISIPSEI